MAWIYDSKVDSVIFKRNKSQAQKHGLRLIKGC